MPEQVPGEPYIRVSSLEAKELMDSLPEIALIDVRAQDEYESGHASGALHIPVDEVLSRFDELPKDKKLFFNCAMGARSGLACEMVAALGITSDNLYNIEDGTPAWIQKGFPVTYGSEA